MNGTVKLKMRIFIGEEVALTLHRRSISLVFAGFRMTLIRSGWPENLERNGSAERRGCH